MPTFDRQRALLENKSLDLFTTTIMCEGVEMPLGRLVEMFKGFFVDNPLEFVRLVEELLNQGAFTFNPGNGTSLVIKITKWGDVRHRRADR